MALNAERRAPAIGTTGATRRRSPLAAGIAALVVLNAVVFLIAAFSHTGVPIPLGFAVIEEPVIVPATIVEGLIGLAFAVGAYGVLTRASWAWPAVTFAHAFGVAGVLLGMAALAAGGGERTELNDIYHRVMLVVLVVGLGLMLTPAGRAALDRTAQDARRG